MLNKEIYKGALGLLAELCDEQRTEDYRERAPYILANFICQEEAHNAGYRRFLGEETAPLKIGVFVSLDAEFPLSDRFIPAAEYYLASLLIDGEDNDRADVLFDRYCKAITDILAQIPAMRERILNAYAQ